MFLSLQKILNQSLTVLLTPQEDIKWNLKMVSYLHNFYLRIKKLFFTTRIKIKMPNHT